MTCYIEKSVHGENQVHYIMYLVEFFLVKIHLFTFCTCVFIEKRQGKIHKLLTFIYRSIHGWKFIMRKILILLNTLILFTI